MFRKSFILFAFALLTGFSVANGQTQPPNDTLRYIDKFPHWLGVHQLTALDFMKVQRSQFKASTYIETYVDAMIDHPAWMFPLLNQFTALRNSGFRNTPHVIFTVRFRPVDDAFSSYEVSVGVTGSPQIPLNFNGIAQGANFIGLNGRRFLSPQDASDEVEQAITEAMRLISRGVGNSLSPNLMVKFNNEVFWNGHEILIGKNGNDQLTLQPLAKFGRRLTSEQVSWTNATGGLVDMAGQNSKTITLTRLDTAASLTVTVKRRSGLGVDLKSILRPIFMQIVQEKLTRMLDSLVNMRVDSVQNANELTDLVSQLEAENVALEPVGTFVPLFSEPITLTDSSGFLQRDNGLKARAFRQVHRRKTLTKVLRTKVNVAAFLAILMRQPDKVDELLDALILNSGTLLGELVLNIGDPNVLQTSRNLILTYLNRNLVNISGSYFGQAPDEPINVRRVLAASRFNPSKKLYINAHFDFPGKDDFEREMNAYLNSLSPPLYVFVNYSQDVSTGTYEARSRGVRPSALPEGTKFLTFSMVNVPGSVKAQLYGSETIQNVGGSSTAEILESAIRGGKGQSVVEDPVIAYWKSIASNIVAQGKNIFGVVYCRECSDVKSNSSLQLNAELTKFTVPGKICLLSIFNYDAGGQIAKNLILPKDNQFVDSDRLNQIALSITQSFDNKRQALSALLINGKSGSCSTYIEAALANICELSDVANNTVFLNSIYSSIQRCLEDEGIVVPTPSPASPISYRLNAPLNGNEKIRVYFRRGQTDETKFESASMNSTSVPNYTVSVQEDGSVSVEMSEEFLKSLGSRVPPSDWAALSNTLNSLLSQAKLNLCEKGSGPTCVADQLRFLQVMNLNLQSLAFNGAIDEAMWQEEGGVRNILPAYAQWDGLGGGVVDGLAEEATGIPMTLVTIGQMAFDETKRPDVTRLFSDEGMRDLTLGIVKSTIETFQDPTKRNHFLAKTGVTVIFMFYAMASWSASVDDVISKADDLASKIDNAPKLRAQISQLVDAKDADKINRLAKLIDEMSAERLERILTLVPEEKIDDLFADLASTPELKKVFDSHLVDSWKRLADLGRNQMRKDPSILTSMRKAMNNSDIPSNRLDDIVNSLAESGARCRTCDNAGTDGLRYIDEVLDDLDGFAKEFKSKSGYDDFLREMGEQGTKATGGSWTLEALMRNRSKYFNGETITGFEVKHVPGRDFAADIVTNVGGVPYYKEFKSWSSNLMGAIQYD